MCHAVQYLLFDDFLYACWVLFYFQGEGSGGGGGENVQVCVTHYLVHIVAICD